MKRLVGVILVAAFAWSAYWVIGQRGRLAEYANWFEARRVQGWVADYDALAVRGYPNRLDVELAGVTLADPASGWAWSAPFLQVLSLSYNPAHVIVVWPEAQQVATPLVKYDVQSARMQASVVRDGAGVLERANMVADALRVTPEGRAALSMTALRVAIAQTEGSAYHIGVQADDLTPPLPLHAMIDPAGRLPQSFAALRADAEVVFDKSWSMGAVEAARPQPVQVRLKLAEAHWGELHVQAAGAFEVDAQGQPVGRITLKAKNWPEIVAMLRAAGSVPEGLLDQVENGLELVARLSGNPKTLDIPLDMKRGLVFLGPVPIGKAPVIRLR